MFWMLSRNIDRLRAEEDVRNLQVAASRKRMAMALRRSWRVCNSGLEGQSLLIKSTVRIWIRQTPTPKSN
jgi:hypothetical protein